MQRDWRPPQGAGPERSTATARRQAQGRLTLVRLRRLLEAALPMSAAETAAAAEVTTATIVPQAAVWPLAARAADAYGRPSGTVSGGWTGTQSTGGRGEPRGPAENHMCNATDNNNIREQAAVAAAGEGG
eukprot:5830329-Alexandrium_andersonii.AAC.1